MLNIFITNLEKYVNGELFGEWVELPMSFDDLDEVMERVQDGNEDAELFITDYEADYVKVNEYDDIYTLNEQAEELDDLDEDEGAIVAAYLEDGNSLEYALKHSDGGYVYHDCYNMTDVAYKLVDDDQIYGELPEALSRYFDYEKFGQELEWDGTFIKLDDCIVELFY